MEKNDDAPYVNKELLDAFGTGEKKKIVKTPRSSYTVAKAKVSHASKPKASSSSRSLIYAAAACLLILGLIIYKPVSDFVALQSNRSSASESIRDVADHSGFNTTGKLMFYRSHPELVNANVIASKCPVADQTTIEYGCYLPTENKIYILEVTDPTYKEVEYTTAAHETLHAVYTGLDNIERTTIANLIKQFYNDTTNEAAVKLHETLKLYGSDETVVDNELHSFVGSEASESDISQSLSSYYNKYFSDRSVPVYASTSFNSKIDNKISSLNTEHTRLGNMIAEIDTYKVQHLDNIQAAMRRANYYGDVDNYNQNVDAYNHNLIYYNSQIDLYNSQRLAYNSEVESFNAILRNFYPTKAQIGTEQ